MKSNAIIRIVVFALAILVLLGILISVLCFYMFATDGTVHVDGPVEITGQGIVSADIQNIEIEWVAGSITIQPDESVNEIHFTEYSRADSDFKMVWKQSGQTLTIQFCEESMKFPSFGINVDISKDLVITVPANWDCRKLDIETASAELEVADLTIKDFDFDGASGICNLNNCQVEKLDLDTASGDIIFTGTLDVLDCDAASANCSITVFNTPRSINMDAASGDLELVLPPEAGFKCQMVTMSGSFESDFEFTMHNDAYVHGDGECKIDVNAMSGDVNILKGTK